MTTTPIEDRPDLSTTPEVVYPESDGKPLGETGIHARTTIHLYGALLHFFTTRKRADVYVATNMFLYYEEGNPRAVRTPDVMVIYGIDGTYERRTFKIWEEAVPGIVFEITSKSTWMEDLVTKSTLYASLGIREYVLFDPLEEYLDRTLQGFRLRDREYVPLEPGDDGALHSEVLGLSMRREEIFLRLFDPASGEIVLSYDEVMRQAGEEHRRAREAAQRAEQEARRAAQEAQRADRATQRADQATQQADQATQQAEQAIQRAEQEARRAAAAETEIERLRALLAGSRGQDQP